MDEGVGDEVTAIEAIDGTHLQSKESEYSLKPGTSDMLELHEMVIPGDGNDHNSSPHFFADILDVNGRIGASEHACASPRCMDEAGVMVEELTLRNYNSDNLAIMGTSNNREKMQTRQSQWQHLYQIAGGSGRGGSHGDAAYRDNSGARPSVWEDVGYTILPEFLDQKLLDDNCNEDTENSRSSENIPVSSNTLLSPGGIRTKVISKSGFSEYFVKNTLKGKGVICRGPAGKGFGVKFRDQTDPKAAGVTMAGSDASLNLTRKTVVPPSHRIAEPLPALYPDAVYGGLSLREWLKAGKNKVNKLKSLLIFKQIVGLVDISHSQGVVLQNIRPSRFKLLPSNQVMYIGSSVQKEIGEYVRDQDIHRSENEQNEKRPLEQGIFPVVSQWAKKRKFGENMNFSRGWPQFPNRYVIKSATENATNIKISGPQDSGIDFNIEHNPITEYKTQSKSSGLCVSNSSQLMPTSISNPLEERWYTSPEELSERCCTSSSNIYHLGVLLFELLSSFDSGRAHAAAMLDLHHRIFPPTFLSENPKEAGFCLSLLHPEPSSRPTTREILQSEFVSGIQESFRDELSSSINQEDAESELLLHFLETLKGQKQNNATKLVEDIRCLKADIEEVERRQTKKSLILSCLPMESFNARGNRFLHREHPSLDVNPNVSPVSNELMLVRNISQLESAYFSVRSNVQLSDNDVTTRDDKEVLKSREHWYQAWKEEEKHKSTDRLGVFFNGLCKYARYSNFEVRGILRNGDFNHSANVICSLSFDRDEDYFASAGVSKKIKIYDFHALFNDTVDIHYPAVEMSNKSRLSCICWNSYIKNYLASTDYDGVVKLWDAGTGQVISQYAEHNRRAWSVDFSQVDPTKLASGSDDYSVKLWNINEKNSLCTIRNIANVCCVQFSADSTHLLAFGSADYKTFCYDLRNVSTPWCILAGHDKAVSHVKFLDSETLVSASTDNTLKLWDLNKTSSSGLSTNACSLTLRGHTNEKNFVGLSVADGYVTCGSETNEVFSYYRSLPMPIASHKFGSIDPISGKETEDDNGLFVSSVCWRRKSQMVVAASSSGCIKLLQMV